MRSYYENELIPQYIGMGGTYEDFWHLNPRRLEVIYHGYREKMIHKADEMYAEAEYAFMAQSAALSNLFRKKGHKPLTFRDFVDKPKQAIEEKPLTEESIKKQREAFVTMFMVKKDNFELANPDKVRR